MKSYFSYFSSSKSTIRWLLPTLLGVVVITWLYDGGSMGKDISFVTFPEIEEISSVSWDYDSYVAYFTDLAEKKGARYAFDVLIEAPMPHGVDIHEIGHHIGYVLYEQKGIGGISECTEALQNACAHAVIIQTLIEHGLSALGEVANVCAEAPGGRGAYAVCFHGVGHGILAYLDYDYKSAVSECRNVYDSVRLAEGPPRIENIENVWLQCVSGATMELMQGSHDVLMREKMQEVYMPASDVRMPCNASYVPDEVRSACYTYVTGRFFEAAGATRGIPSPEFYPKTFSYCEKIPATDAKSIDACYRGIGSNFVFLAAGDARSLEHMSDQSLKDIHAWCALAGKWEGQTGCVLSALSTIFGGGQVESPSATSFCKYAEDVRIRDYCYEALISGAKQVFKGTSKLTKLCLMLPASYQQECSVTF